MDELAQNLLRTVYLHGDETVEGMFRRVVEYVMQKEDEATRRQMLEEMKKLRFLPNTPTLMNAGATSCCLSACFVLPIEDTMESVLQTQYKMARIHSMGGGTGFSFSALRPRGARVGSGGEASGPLAFMRAFDATTAAVKQGGRRRGANMGVLDISHPDIEEFIKVKRDLSELQNFNLSVMIPDKFLVGVQGGLPFETTLFDKVVESAWLTGEPGVLFYDRINRDNPVPSLGPIESVNPCGEVPLPAPAVCNLGSIDVSKFVEDGRVNWEELGMMIRLAVRFLDDVIDMGNYPFPELEEAAKKTRAIGLGVMGFADTLLKLRISYSSEEAVRFAHVLGEFLREKAEGVTYQLAQERGSFPLQPEGQGRRNAMLLSIAPTGSISRLAGCSSGVEPNFAWVTTQRSLGKEFEVVHPLYESLRNKEKVPDYFVTAHEVPWEQHVKIQAAFQKYVDGGVSKTINLPRDATKDDVKAAILLAHELGCKGVTVYRDGCREGQVLKDAKLTGGRPLKREGITKEQKIGCGTLFLHVNRWDEKVREVFAHVGKEGGCPAQSAALGILLSDIAQGKTSLSALAEDLRGIKCHSCIKTGAAVLSCPDAIARTLLDELKGEPIEVRLTRGELEEVVGRECDTCPECGEALARAGGCKQCLHCGWSKCG